MNNLNKYNLYKTEFCQNWTDNGVCHFGLKCVYAHDPEELRKVTRHPKYKTELCKKYHSGEICLYGVRCRFIHDLNESEGGLGKILKIWNDAYDNDVHSDVYKLF